MLTKDGCRLRRLRLWEHLNPKPDSILLGDPKHLIYFANFLPSPFSYRSNDAGAFLLMEKEGAATLITDTNARQFADQAHVDAIQLCEWYQSLENPGYRKSKLLEAANSRLRSHRQTLAIDVSSLPYELIESLRKSNPNLVIQDIEPTILALRRAKMEDELTVIRFAMKAGEAAHAAAMRDTEHGMSERDVYLLALDAATEAVGRQVQIYGDFVSGERCAKRGGLPTDRKIQANELVLLDFSVVIDGYRGDFTNTFCCGEPSKEQIDCAELCIQSMKAGEALLRPGVACKEVDFTVREAFRGKLPGDFVSQSPSEPGSAQHEFGLHFFPHHVGHGIGLSHPEAPYLVPRSEDVLREGDVITLEPGLYRAPSIGMRFERNYLITSTGFELLSHHHLGLQR